MSGRLVSAVFESGLAPWLKPYAVVFASFANDAGARCFPTVGHVARMVGRTPRATKWAVRELRELGVLKEVAPAGRYRAIRYWFDVSALPRREISTGSTASTGMGEAYVHHG